TKSKRDLMVFVTNVFFPVQNPPEYKQLFRRGGCPRWLLDPRLGPPRLSADWLPSAGWRYDVPNSTIIYSSTNEAREPPHTFPFNLFLPRRMSSRFALIKRDFFCQNSQIQSTILLEGANEAGLLFRGIGERNFWAVLLQKGGGIYLIRVKNGEKQILGTVGNFRVQGAEGEEPVRYTRQQENMEEARPKGYEECTQSDPDPDPPIAREPPHTFPFNLFLPRRMSSRFALIKRDFFCQNSQIQSTILLEGANEAGLLFRGIGERNFWAVLLQKGGGIYLIRVKNGEKQILGTVGNFRVQGAEGEEPVRYTRQQENMEEARPKGYEECTQSDPDPDPPIPIPRSRSRSRS
ncbi:hypothetical protein, conserved, partial [Eimeria acervulina]